MPRPNRLRSLTAGVAAAKEAWRLAKRARHREVCRLGRERKSISSGVTMLAGNVLHFGFGCIADTGIRNRSTRDALLAALAEGYDIRLCHDGRLRWLPEGLPRHPISGDTRDAEDAFLAWLLDPASDQSQVSEHRAAAYSIFNDYHNIAERKRK